MGIGFPVGSPHFLQENDGTAASLNLGLDKMYSEMLFALCSLLDLMPTCVTMEYHFQIVFGRRILAQLASHAQFSLEQFCCMTGFKCYLEIYEIIILYFLFDYAGTQTLVIGKEHTAPIVVCSSECVYRPLSSNGVSWLHSNAWSKFVTIFRRNQPQSHTPPSTRSTMSLGNRGNSGKMRNPHLLWSLLPSISL